MDCPEFRFTTPKRTTNMKIIPGKTYEIDRTNGTVCYLTATLDGRQRLFEGLPVYWLEDHGFVEDGRPIRFDISTLTIKVETNPLFILREVDEDRKRRHDAGKLILAIADDFAAVRSGRVNNPFSCGTASDEIIAQAERVLAEMTKLRKMLDETCDRVG